MGQAIRPLPGQGKDRKAAWIAVFQGVAGNKPLRERICGAIREAIRSGRLRRGDRLPSSRVLAQDLQVSRITAEAAYAQLEAEEYVHRRVGDGTYVSVDMAVGRLRDRAFGRPSFAHPWSRRGQRVVRGGGCHDPREAVGFTAGFPDLSQFPLNIWKQLTARRLRTTRKSLLGYGDPAGEPELRQAIARYLAESRGVRCSMEQVLVLTSSQQAIQLVAAMLTDSGDRVCIEEPGYVGAQTALTAAGARLHPLPVDRDGAAPPRNAGRLTYLTPSHQYPMGVTLSLERRLEFIEVARKRGQWILEDDYDSEFQYDARPAPAMQGLDRDDRVLYLGTFSKVLFPGLRLAYLVLPRALMAGFVTARSTHDGHPARLAQLVTADFMEEGHFRAHVRRMRRLYGQRRDLLIGGLERHTPSWCRPVGVSAGLQLTVALPGGTEPALTLAAGRSGLAVTGMSGLFLTRPSFDGWVLGFAALDDKQIVEGVHRLSTIRPPRGFRLTELSNWEARG